MDFNPKFLASIRKLRGISQEALAARISVTRNTIARYESLGPQAIVPDLKTINKLADELGIDPRWFFEEGVYDPNAFRRLRHSVEPRLETQEIAKILGCDTQLVADWQRTTGDPESKTPSINDIAKLCEILKCKKEDFFIAAVSTPVEFSPTMFDDSIERMRQERERLYPDEHRADLDKKGVHSPGKLFKARNKAKLSQSQLAEAICQLPEKPAVSRDDVAAWESAVGGPRSITPSLEMQGYITEALDCDLADLLEYPSPVPPTQTEEDEFDKFITNLPRATGPRTGQRPARDTSTGNHKELMLALTELDEALSAANSARAKIARLMSRGD